MSADPGLTVAGLLARCLEREGVERVFGVPGEETEDVLFALERSAIEFVPTRHEQGAAFMANVSGRLTGRAGVCLATLGPGATNLITGVADANLDKAPLVAITAQGGLARLHHESHQRLDVVSLFEPITKWNTSIATPSVVAEVVRKAFKLAEAEKPGATHVELSEDVAAQPASGAPLERRCVRRPSADAKALGEAAQLLRNARRPLILAGNGAIRTRASDALCKLAEAYAIPVASTFMGKGAISDRSPLSLRTVGLGFRDFVVGAFERADLVVTVGYDIAECAPDLWDFGRPLIHVDFDPAEVYAEYDPQLEVVGDVATTLTNLHRLLTERHPQADVDWYGDLRAKIVAEDAHYAPAPGVPLSAPSALHVLRDVLPDRSRVVCDVGAHKLWVARQFPTYVPNGTLISNGLASMGIALPGAIAAALVNSTAPVVAVCGDGGFLMNVQELETARRLGVRLTVLVLNDDDYGLISWKQRRSRGRSTGTRLGNPDLAKLAESFGWRGVRAPDPDALRTCLTAAIASPVPTVIEAPIDPSANDELVERLGASH